MIAQLELSTCLGAAVEVPAHGCAASAGSIISKKGAESLSALVLDVKFGGASVCKELESAAELAELLVSKDQNNRRRHKHVLSNKLAQKRTSEKMTAMNYRLF